MRILVDTIFYSPELTGVAKYTAEMCEWLVARGHEVEVICPPPYYPQWQIRAPYRQWRYQSEIINGVSVTRCPIWLPKQPAGLQRILYSLSFMLSSFPIVLVKARRKHDVVLVLQPSFLNSIPALCLAKLAHALSWSHVHDFEIDIGFKLGQLRHPRLKSLLTRFERWLMQRFDVASTISSRMMDTLLEKGVDESRCVLFPNWVDTDEIYPATTVALRSELAISSGTIVALFSGTLGAKQGLETLLGAAKILGESRSEPDVLILICGEGTTARRLQSQAAKLRNVRFIPLQPRERLNDLLNSADVHVLTQVAQVSDAVLPSKLLGMLASGRPVIATVNSDSEVGAVVKECGLLVNPGDADGLAQAIRTLATNAPERGRLGTIARSQAIRFFRQGVILERFETEILRRIRSAKPIGRARQEVGECIQKH